MKELGTMQFSLVLNS